ncbi:hypothetical protein T265_08993 [Opisthorchis viverrini]|uniref:Uncharacterized protein n=1 Tax=Opisthorchis viverrini TaxID=6198 RepID=A0A074Z7G5_OPIVI|nr:hypothetical protein T265_08993 [Opisthorchis viverrini]KER23048.1 hypothetical protein T265_08993 [Opisthorchis viverrini]
MRLETLRLLVGFSGRSVVTVNRWAIQPRGRVFRQALRYRPWSILVMFIGSKYLHAYEGGYKGRGYWAFAVRALPFVPDDSAPHLSQPAYDPVGLQQGVFKDGDEILSQLT